MLIGLDAGTSVVKAVAFSDDGEVVRVASRPTTTHVPAPGRTEQDIEEVIAAAAATLREVAAGETPRIIGITAQGDGVWLMDAEGKPIRPAILWSDARAAAIVEHWMANGVAVRAFRRSGNMLFPGAAAPTLAYLMTEDPAALAEAATAGYCKDAIVQRLTGVRATDVSDASLPFFNHHTLRYDPELLALYGVAECERLLAPVDPVPGPLRPLSAAGAALTGLPEGVPIHAGPFDLCATTIGAGMDRPGDGLVIVGTTLGCGVIVDQVETDGAPAGMLLALHQPNRWVRVMPAMVGTPSLEWALALTGIPLDGLDAALAATNPGADGLLCLPLLSPAGERAPFVDPAARGQLIGLSLETTGQHILRAVCEGIAYAARHCLDLAGLAPDGAIYMSGGGMKSAGWRQILADVLGKPLLLARQPEVGARGAAMAALDAAGIPCDRRAWTLPDGVIEPDPARARFYDVGYAAYRERLDSAIGQWSGPRWRQPE
ncbi:MAG: FGGY family carbohydrate kinase [Thermomicrobiales bacterium]